jgi:hypothetical protein
MFAPFDKVDSNTGVMLGSTFLILIFEAFP